MVSWHPFTFPVTPPLLLDKVLRTQQEVECGGTGERSRMGVSFHAGTGRVRCTITTVLIRWAWYLVQC